MKTTQLKYLLKSCLIACCFCLSAINLQAQGLTGGGSGGSGYSTDICSINENPGICLTDFVIQSDTEGFIVTITCDGQSQMFAIPVGDAITIDADLDGWIDDVQIVLEVGTEIYELLYGTDGLQNEEMDCWVETEVVSTNSIALVDNEIPPLQIAGTPFNGTINIGNWLSNQQFYLVKVVFPNTIASVITCSVDPPEGDTIPFETCTNSGVSIFTLLPVTIMNWEVMAGHWSMEDVKTTYSEGTNSCTGTGNNMSASSSSGTIMNLSLSNVSSNTIKDYSVDFRLKNDAGIEFKLENGTVCSENGSFISLPLNIPLAKRKKVRAGLLATTFKQENNEDLETLTRVQVFPNPCSNNLNINYNIKNEVGKEYTENKIEVKVYNSNGNLVKTLQQNISGNKYQQQINTANWKEGMYYCASYKNGELLAVKPFLKVN